jgi:hypothetical protein
LKAARFVADENKPRLASGMPDLDGGRSRAVDVYWGS